MKEPSTLLLFLAAVLLTTACEHELPFDVKNNPPKLIMNAQINADSLNHTLFLNLSGQSKLGEVTDATVEIRVNGQLAETAQLLPKEADNEIGKRFRFTTPFHPGDLVRIDAITTDGKYHAWAEVIVPQPIAVEKWDTATTFLKSGNYSEEFLRYKVTFSDRPGEKNYYRIALDRQITLYQRIDGGEERFVGTEQRKEMIIREDVVLTDGQPTTSDDDNFMFPKESNLYGVFDDARFCDSSYTMTIYAPNPNWNSGPGSSFRWTADAYIRLLSITEAEYYYLKALNVIESDVYDEVLMEPIKFASNVNGGIGLVSISAESHAKITLY